MVKQTKQRAQQSESEPHETQQAPQRMRMQQEETYWTETLREAEALDSALAERSQRERQRQTQAWAQASTANCRLCR
jgi:hypothetical protein